MVRYYMHRPSAVDIRFSARSCPYCLDDDGVGQNSVCNDGFYECDAIARILVNTMVLVKTLTMMLLAF